MNRLLLCALLFALPLAACKRRSASPPAAPDAHPTPPNPVEDLRALNDAVRAHVMGQLKEPDTLDDLVKTGFMKRLPTPPPGKKYVLDAKKSSVKLVDR